mgnify:FL=1
MRNNYNRENKGKTFSTNEAIKALEVRVIDQNGEMLGVISTKLALEKAQDAGFDLIEVSPNVKPPVCKIGNFGKMRYEMQKKAADAKKKQKTVDLKEIKMSFNIGRGDFLTKVSKIEKFIKNGDKVKVSMRMRGREITHIDLARVMINEVVEMVESYAKPDISPRQEGMQLTVTFSQI